MVKYFYATIIAFFLFGLVLLSPSPMPVSAAYNTVTFANNATASLWGIPLDLTVSSGSVVESITVNSNNLSIGMRAGSTITLTDSSRHVLGNSENVETDCTAYYSRITIPSAASATITVTPSTVICGTQLPSTAGTPPVVSSGSTGDSSSIVTTEEEEEAAAEEEEVEALPTETAAAEAIEVTAAEGGTAEATTDQGTRAKLELPANAVTADAEVTITPTQQTETTVATQVAAVPSGESLVGGYVYDYSVSAAGEAVSTFEESVTVSLTYTDLQISGLDEDTLTIAYYDEDTSVWVELETTVDKDNNKVTATVDHLTLFALIAEPGEEEGEEEEEEEEEEEAVTKPISEMTIEELKAEIARIAALIAQLQQELLKIIAAEGGSQLTSDLQLGDRGDGVTLLQTWLARDPAVYPDGIISGWFGPLTKTAVIRFQEKYYDDVLAPWNFSKGTGYVGSTTRAKLNALYGGQ